MGIGALNYQGVKGGLKLNDIIEEFKYVYKEQEIKAGDFVNYINGVAGQTTETSIDTRISELYNIGNDSTKAILLENGDVFITYADGNYDLYGKVCKVDGVNISYGTDILLATQARYGEGLDLVSLSDNRVLIGYCYGGSNYLYGIVAKIDNLSITVGATKAIGTTSSYGGRRPSLVPLSNGNILALYSYDGSSYVLYAVVVTVTGVEISYGSSLAVGTTTSSTKTGQYKSGIVLADGRIFVAHNYSSDMKLYGTILSISGTTVSLVIKDSAILTTAKKGYLKITPILLADGSIFIAHTYDSTYSFGAIVISISGTSITKGTDYQISTIANSGTTATPLYLNNDKILTVFSVEESHVELGGAVLTVANKIITVGTTVLLNDAMATAYATSLVPLKNGTVFLSHQYRIAANSTMYAQVIAVINDAPSTTNIPVNLYEQQVTLATEPSFGGIALSSGVGGDDTGHNQQVKIARPIIYVPNLISNGDFSKGIEGWYNDTAFCSLTVSNNKGVVTMLSDNTSGWTTIYCYYNEAYDPFVPAGHVYYFKCVYSTVEVNNGSQYGLGVRIALKGPSVSDYEIILDEDESSVEDRVVTHLGTKTTDVNMVRLGLTGGEEGDVGMFSNIALYDLTAKFGAGNEPTKEWCDNNL